MPVSVTFQGYKGLNIGQSLGGGKNGGNALWLTQEYDRSVQANVLSMIAGLGVHTTAVWLNFDRMLKKRGASWGTGTYTPQYESRYVDNFNDWLGILHTSGLETIVTVTSVGSDPLTTFDNDTYLVPNAGKWTDYINVFHDFLSKYTRTKLGGDIAAWILLKEAPIATWDTWLAAAYTNLRTIPALQPIGVDVTGTLSDARIALYAGMSDFYCMHIYRDDGYVLPFSTPDLPWIIGECGADTANLNNAAYNLPAVGGFLRQAWKRGCLAVFPWNVHNDTLVNMSLIAGRNSGYTMTYGTVGTYMQGYVDRT